MQSSNIPTKFSIPFANSAGAGYIRSIPVASQIPITPGAASLTDGFPPLNDVPVASGGIPPSGADFNGILNQISAWNRWQNAGGSIPWDSAFATAIGGYPKGASVASPNYLGVTWLNTLENNTNTPETGGGIGWVAVKQNDMYQTLPDTGSANAYSATNHVPLTASTLVDGTVQRIRFAHTNTGSSTFSPDGLTPRVIINAGQGLLTAGQIYGGLTGELVFDAAQNYWILIWASNGNLYIPGGSTGVTQALNDASDRLATDHFVQNQINSIVFFAAGTRMPFAQAAAPTGWTQDVSDSANNRMLRVITTSGGGVGGSSDPTINNVVPSHTHGFTTGYMSNDHSHGISDPGHTHGMNDPGHNHVVNDPTHSHSVNDPAHSHSVNDPGHSHPIIVRARNNTGNGISDSGDVQTYTGATNGATTGIGIYGAYTGISLYGTATGIYLGGSYSGTYLSYAATGISTGGVSANHTHSGSTDNGSSQVNWVPRYINMIICTKN